VTCNSNDQNVVVAAFFFFTFLQHFAVGRIKAHFGTGRFLTVVGIQPGPALLKGGRVQVQRHGQMSRILIAHLVIPHGIVDKGDLTLRVNLVVRAFQTGRRCSVVVVVGVDAGVFVGDVSIPTLKHLALQHFHPASIARVIVNGRRSMRIPTQQEQRVRGTVGGNQIARVVARGVRVGVARHVWIVDLHAAH